MQYGKRSEKRPARQWLRQQAMAGGGARSEKVFRRGFTMAELLVSIGVLVIISISVVRDIGRTRYQEELISGARLLVTNLRDMQSRALSASSVKTCTPSMGVTAVCEHSTAVCSSAPCNTTVSPGVFGVTLINGQSQFTTFADVNGTSNYREDLTGLEQIKNYLFPRPNPTTALVMITGLSADSIGVTSSTVTFDRQRGVMRINACLSGPCTPAEASVLSITLTHARTNKTKVVYLNVVTGKIEVQ